MNFQPVFLIMTAAWVIMSIAFFIQRRAFSKLRKAHTRAQLQQGILFDKWTKTISENSQLTTELQKIQNENEKLKLQVNNLTDTIECHKWSF